MTCFDDGLWPWCWKTTSEPLGPSATLSPTIRGPNKAGTTPIAAAKRSPLLCSAVEAVRVGLHSSPQVVHRYRESAPGQTTPAMGEVDRPQHMVSSDPPALAWRVFVFAMGLQPEVRVIKRTLFVRGWSTAVVLPV